MPIEIKEVIIRTTVEKDPFADQIPEQEMKKLEEMKRDLLRSCEVMINKVIKNQSRR
jgi:hypothetical protein